MGSKPIANKHHEGKVRRTLKRELKVPELAERKADGTSVSWCRLMRTTVIAHVISASGGVGFDPSCVLFLALYVIDGVVVRTTLGTWLPRSACVNVPSRTHRHTANSL